MLISIPLAYRPYLLNYGRLSDKVMGHDEKSASAVGCAKRRMGLWTSVCDLVNLMGYVRFFCSRCFQQTVVMFFRTVTTIPQKMSQSHFPLTFPRAQMGLLVLLLVIIRVFLIVGLLALGRRTVFIDHVPLSLSITTPRRVWHMPQYTSWNILQSSISWAR